MLDIVKEIYNEVKNRCYLPSNIYGSDVWNYYIKLQYDIITKIYNKYKADYEIVALTVLLCNIASITDLEYIDEKYIIGSSLAKELLEKYNYDINKLKIIREYILNNNEDFKKKYVSTEEMCIFDSKNMLNFYNIPYILKRKYKENKELEESNNEVLNGLTKNYLNLSPIGKKIINSQYKAIKLVLSKH